MSHIGEKIALVRLLVWLLGIAWLAFLALAVWPAWQEQLGASAMLEEREAHLAGLQQVTGSIPAVSSRLNRVQQEVREREAALLMEAVDTDLIRQITSIAGPAVQVTSLTVGERHPLTPNAADEESPYWWASCGIDATGGWANLVDFLQGLEWEVPGLRVEAVQLRSAEAAGQWRLQISGSIYLLRSPMPESPDQTG